MEAEKNMFKWDGFNRYIVECKFNSECIKYLEKQVLIDT